MPEPLWAAAVSLAREHGAWRVARELRIRHDSLKTRLGDAGARDARAVTRGFVEVAPLPPRPEAATNPSTVVELSRVDGARLTLRLASASAPDLHSLISAFCPMPR
jgi:hypothetical protein